MGQTETAPSWPPAALTLAPRPLPPEVLALTRQAPPPWWVVEAFGGPSMEALRSEAQAAGDRLDQARREDYERWATPARRAKWAALKGMRQRMAHLPDHEVETIAQRLSRSWHLLTMAEREELLGACIAEVERRYGDPTAILDGVRRSLKGARRR